MRKINVNQITKEIERLYSKVNFEISGDILRKFASARKVESLQLPRQVLQILSENAEIARKEKIPLCQDTGLAVVFLQIGQEVLLVGGDLNEAVNDGIKNAVKKEYLRASVVSNPLIRINTKDNTPAILHTEIVPGNRIKIHVMAKGGGAENMSALKMLTPADGEKGVVNFVLDTVKNAGANPCPPIIVGVGIGGNFEKCAFLAKKALLRKLGTENKDKKIAKLEKLLLNKINSLKIGPAGLGGKTTCLAVHIETFPCHIASLPVAVNIECHSHRYAEAII